MIWSLVKVKDERRTELVPESLDALHETVTLHLEHWGPPDAQRVVCLHGVTGHGRHFTKLAEALSGHHVLAPDLLGHGSSPYEPPWDLETHLDAIVETVGAAPAILIGHSFGGRLALGTRGPRAEARPEARPRPRALGVAARRALRCENARKERRYVSFEEGVDRRYDESQLTRAPRELVEEELRGHLVWDDGGGYRYRYSHAAVVAAYGVMASQPTTFERARVRRSSCSAKARTCRPTHGWRPTGSARRPSRARRRSRRAHRALGRVRGDDRGGRDVPRAIADAPR